jgi:hypothetical protein
LGLSFARTEKRGRAMLSKYKRAFCIGTLMLLVLPMVACGKSIPIPTNPEEILDQAANVTQVKYDCYTVWTDSSGSSREGPIANVMVKGTKMRVGWSQPDESREEYLIDFDGQIMYVWNPPENKPREMQNAWEVPEMTSSIIWAKGIKSFNPQIIGTETIDQKECLVIEFNIGQDNSSGKAWVWIEHPFLVQMELSGSNGKVLIHFKNIDFGDIPDSTFELPGPVSTIGSGTAMPPATTPTSPSPDILSPDDSVELVSINPVSGTILNKGTVVQFSVTTKYELKSVEKAFIQALLFNENINHCIHIGPGFEIQKGSGTAVIESSVDINFLIEVLKSDKVVLTLDLYYYTSSNEMKLLVRRLLKDCFFIVDSSSLDEQNGAGASPSATATTSPSKTSVPQPPELNFNAVIDGLSVTVNGGTRPMTPGTAIIRIHWDWGDGYSEDHWFPASHIYSQDGTYTVTVTSYQSNGLSTTKSIKVTVNS